MRSRAPSSCPSLRAFAARLRSMKNVEMATQLLWLAAEGQLDVLEDGTIGFWANSPVFMRRREPINSRVCLAHAERVHPAWPGPRAEAAIWGAVAPEQIEAVELDTRGEPVLTLREFVLKLRVEEEPEALLHNPPRKGSSRLYPRLARRAPPGA